ncbi:MAG: tRNA (adenosine(37)-N6)-threonylcarbamoyltransferase complex dimerization subunit type 1 TsaB, partial [Armatimonadota bacterium]|nr:tRNA (adenosine(37)-N6)-threonylcarbamoyltransferase complex dimerization subunit type 1 TsaB [Armatimonadota bacterium]
LQRLAPNIKWALDDSGLTPNDLDAVAVSLGPGSFTGIRIGVTTAKGLAYAADKKIIGLPTLDIFAAGVMAEPMDLIVPLLVARPGEVYNAIYRFDGKRPAKLTEDSALSIDELNDRILGLKPRRIVFCGPGSRANREAIEEHLGDKTVFTPTWADHPRGEIMGQLAAERFAAGQFDDAFSLVPLYVRRPTPEIRMESLKEAKKAK